MKNVILILFALYSNLALASSALNFSALGVGGLFANVSSFTSSGTWNAPSTAIFACVNGIAPGGGGGGGAAVFNNASGGGGGGGACNAADASSAGGNGAAGFVRIHW